MDKRIKFYVANSFARTNRGGNPAGVVVDSECLDDQEMQFIARQLNLVETVFISWDKASHEIDLRFFTPDKELPVAGHPTIAAFTVLIRDYFKEPAEGEYIIRTKGGRQPVSVIKSHSNYVVRMTQNTASFLGEESNIARVADILGIDKDDIVPDLPVQAVDTGLGHLVVPVKSIESLNRLVRKADLLRELCQSHGVREVQAFTVIESNVVQTRNICPKQGLEDPACGMGNGALGAYLLKNCYDGQESLCVEALQGDIVSMPSGVCGCQNGRTVCCDGMFSPTCTCN